MIKLDITSVKPGMRLGKSIHTAEGRLLLEAGILLKDPYIDKLSNIGIKEVQVDWNPKLDRRFYDSFFQSTKEQMEALVEEAFTENQFSSQIELSKLRDLVKNLLDNLSNNNGIMVYLTDIRNIDSYTFGHSINVCIFSLILGNALNLTPEELVDLGVGALIHDIGKIAISKEVLNKPGRLEEHEFEEIKNHALLGYKIVCDLEGISEVSSLVVRQHHERYNGTGYPDGLRGNEIHLFSRIVAICDVYDALTSNRVYKKKISPHLAVEYLISMGNHEFDYKLVRTFISNIVIFPIGTLVKFNTGESAEIVGINQDYPTRPLVKVKYDEFGNPIDSMRILDLKKHLYINIEKVV